MAQFCVGANTVEEAMQWHRFRNADPGLIWLRNLLTESARRIDETDLPDAGRR